MKMIAILFFILFISNVSLASFTKRSLNRGIVDPTTESTESTESTTESTEFTTDSTDTSTDTPTSKPGKISCTNNDDCPTTQPYCQQFIIPSLNFCQVCLNHNDCRAKGRCNAECVADFYGVNRCVTPAGQTRLQCSFSQVCYKNEAR